MMKRIFWTIVIVIVLAACQNNHQSQEQPNNSPFLRISNPNNAGETPQGNLMEEPNGGIPDAAETPQGDLLEEPKGETPEEQEPPVSDAPNQISEPKGEITIEEETASSPSYGIPQAEPEKQPELEKPDSSENQGFRLPFTDFKERWNAIAEEQGSGLTISELKKEDNVYKSMLKGSQELRIYPKNDLVQSVQLHTERGPNQDKLLMLVAWSHVLFMFEPETDIHQIDELFREFGVGPNLDVSDVGTKTVERAGIRYTVEGTQTSYQFEAAYKSP